MIFTLFQQWCLIAAVQDLGSDSRSHEGSTSTGEYLEACNLLFERGLLIHCRINNNNSPVLINIRKWMTFFEQWCADHEETGNFIIKEHGGQFKWL